MRKGKILIIEDEFAVAENLKIELLSMGYEVVGLASSGLEAMELAQNKMPDMALMDIKLCGEMDGIETAIQFRRKWDVPALFLSAFADENNLERAKIAEPLGYLIKPFEQKGLRAGIETACYKARMDKLLKQSESRFRSMFENIPIAYLVLDASSRCIDFNAEFCRLLGFDRIELIGQYFVDLLSPEIRHLYPEHFRKIETDGRLQTQLSLVDKKNAIRIVNFKVQIQGAMDDAFFRAHCIMVDVTEQKRLEDEGRQAREALWEQHELQKVLFSAIPAAAYVKDIHSVYLIGNKRFSELCGVPEDEIPGKTDFDIFSKMDAVNFCENDAEIIATGQARLDYEIGRKDAEGNPIWFSASKCPYHGSSGEIAGLIGLCFNITERKRAEEKRLQLEQRLQQSQKAESLARICGAVAHHFNNQLQVVMGNLELALETRSLLHNVAKNMTEAMKAARKAAEVSGLMLTCRGQAAGKQIPVDLSELCTKSLPLFMDSSPKNVLFTFELPSPGPVIKANPGQIQQVLMNLIINAWEASGENQSTVTLTVKTAAFSQILPTHRYPLEWQPDEINYACIEVKDTGSGIAKENINKIFDPFFTVKFTGRGLGLPVSLGIASAHRGGITVESEIGQGSIFRIFFPLSDEKADIFPKIQGESLWKHLNGLL